MSPRREFTREVRKAIVRRATKQLGARSVIVCEGCGLVDPRVWHIDHTNPDALQVDKSRPLAADDGRLLCAGSPECCHDRKTRERDRPAIDKAKRNEAKHSLGRRPSSSLSRTKAEIDADKAARSADRSGGKIAMPAPRSLFI